MSKRWPWYKRDVDAWRGGTRSMSMELRGFYSECLDAMWDLQGPLPKDSAKLAVMLCTNPRTVRKLMPALIDLGKIVETETGYANPRMMADIEDASSRIRTELEPNLTGIRSEFVSKVAKNGAKSKTVLTDVDVDRDIEKDNTISSSSVPKTARESSPEDEDRSDFLIDRFQTAVAIVAKHSTKSEAAARMQVEAWAEVFGAEAVIGAAHRTRIGIDEGTIAISPVGYMSRIMRDDAYKAATMKATTGKNSIELLREICANVE